MVQQEPHVIDKVERGGAMAEQEFKPFCRTKAFERLKKLAENPYDLTAPGGLAAGDRFARYVCRTELFDLHYATQRVDDGVLSALQDLADELRLVDQFREMRRGAVLNRIEGFESEERQVLHTAARDLFADAAAEPEASGDAERELRKLDLFLRRVDTGEICNHRGERFDTMIHVGIGGSDLGPRSVYEALRFYNAKGRTVHFVANVDPDDGAAVLARVNLSTSLVNIVSKSGTTLETLANEKYVQSALVNAGLEPSRHCLAVTGKGSPMDNPERYLESFYMFDYIGGRYSVTSMVGAVMLGFCLGLERVKEFLRGAAFIDSLAEEEKVVDNLPLLLALLGLYNHNFLHCPTQVILPYSQALHRFPAHLQQCDMESNGKSIDRYGRRVNYKTGPVIWGEPGTNSQHAFYQLLHQGTEIVPAEFIGFRKSQYGRDITVAGSSSQQKLLANMLAQMVAMAAGRSSSNPNKVFPGNRPSCLLLADRLTPRTMGALLSIYEAKIIFQGFAWNINSFDQEGVQLGKVLAGRFLEAMSGSEPDDNSLERLFLKQL
jgi:glucose-6-phosphate isomerase